MIRWLRTDPVGLVGGFWALWLIGDLIISEIKERRRA